MSEEKSTSQWVCGRGTSSIKTGHKLQQCQSEFPNANDDVLKWCVLNPNIQYSAYVCRGREKPETHLPLNKQESENSFERMFSFFTQTE